ncbi:MAG: flagellar hook-associated protein FlgK [Rhodoferax sp.]|jgi:flagellar hook-associated protein 1 FlgK
MSILNIGTRALQANQVALQTAGNNIANVNTPGYSRQTVVMQTVEGQFTGGGYIGKGVDVSTIKRNFDQFLTTQSTLASSTQAADTVRSNYLSQLEGLFPGGASGLGASINNTLNAFSDVASAPTDLTARTVVLTSVDETAARIRSASKQLDDLQGGVSQTLSQNVDAINSLAKSIADVNGSIARATGSGQPPNDLLDRRDQLVRDLNQYVQTTSIPADDGTVGVFIGGSQPLVLGTTVSPVSLVQDFGGGPVNNKLAINRNGSQIMLDENTLGGGSVPGLLRFQNTDLVEGRNLLGRLTMAVTTEINNQQALGLDLDGNVGGNIFSPTTFSSQNVLTPTSPAQLNTGTASLTLSISDTSQFAASDYEVAFSGPAAGTITRRSDGLVVAFPQVPPTIAPILATLDGINVVNSAGVAAAGDRFLLKPFATSATTVSREFSTPRGLAVASPVVGQMGSANTGSLQQTSLVARSNPPSIAPVVLTFTGANSYTRSDELPFPNTTSYAYTPGVPIEGTEPVTTPLSQWSLTLQGSPKPGDTFTVSNSKVLDAAGTIDLKLNSGNATAIMNLRDKPMFDGAVLSDGYAGLIAQIGIRAQSATNAAQVSTSIAGNLETARTGVSGVNLDEEAAKLLQYQQAYQASAKTIQIAQSIFDTLLQTISR